MAKIQQLYDTADGSQQEATPVGSVKSLIQTVTSSSTTYFDAPVAGKVIGMFGYMTALGGAAAAVTLSDSDGNGIADTDTGLNNIPDTSLWSASLLDDDHNEVAKGERLALTGGAVTETKVWVEFSPS